MSWEGAVRRKMAERQHGAPGSCEMRASIQEYGGLGDGSSVARAADFAVSNDASNTPIYRLETRWSCLCMCGFSCCQRRRDVNNVQEQARCRPWASWRCSSTVSRPCKPSIQSRVSFNQLCSVSLSDIDGELPMVSIGPGRATTERASCRVGAENKDDASRSKQSSRSHSHAMAASKTN